MYFPHCPAAAAASWTNRPLLSWRRSVCKRFEPRFHDNLKRVYYYRKQVLAIFDELIGTEKNRARVN